MRAAPIVCPEESPQCARRRTPLPPAGPDEPTPAQEQGLQPTLDPQKAYMAAEHAALLEAGLSEDLADRAQAFAAQRA